MAVSFNLHNQYLSSKVNVLAHRHSRYKFFVDDIPFPNYSSTDGDTSHLSLLSALLLTLLNRSSDFREELLKMGSAHLYTLLQRTIRTSDVNRACLSTKRIYQGVCVEPVRRFNTGIVISCKTSPPRGVNWRSGSSIPSASLLNGSRRYPQAVRRYATGSTTQEPKVSFFSRFVPAPIRAQPSSGASFRKLLELARPERKPLATAIGLLLVSSSVSMSIPFTIGRLIDFFSSSAPVCISC